ncbi:MAG: ABC transporter permease [Faecousia sp.]
MKEKTNSISTQHRFGKYLREVIPFVGLLLMLLVFGILTEGKLLRPKNLLLILNQAYVLLIAATGVFFVMTIGGLDFSQGSIIGVAGIVIAYVARINVPLAVVCGVLTGALIGLINGVMNVFVKIPSFIVTICTMFLFRGVCKYLTTDAPVNAPLSLNQLDVVALKLPVTLAILIIGYVLFRHTSLGAKVKAIGAGEIGARFAGIKVGKIKLLIFTVAGCLTGFAAFINLLKVGSVTATGGNLVETNLLIALVLGGFPIGGGAKARFSSVIIGCLLYAVMNNGLVMLRLEPSVQQLIQGLIFMVVVAITADRKSGMAIK